MSITTLDSDIHLVSENDRRSSDTIDDPASNSYSALPFLKLFRFADGVDKALITVGVLSCVITGLSHPATNFALAIITDVLVCYVKNNNMHSIAENTTSYCANSSCADPAINATKSFFDLNCTSSYETWREIRYLTIAIAVMGAIDLIFGYFRVATLNIAANNQFRRISCMYMKSVLQQNIAWFDDERSGEFAVNSMEGLQKYKSGIGSTFGCVLSMTVSSIAAFTLACAYGWELTLVCTSSFILFFLAIAITGKLIGARQQYETEAQMSAGSFIEEIQSALKTVVAFGGEAQEAKRFSEDLDITRKTCIKKSSFAAVPLSLIKCCLYIALGLTFWYGLKLSAEDYLSPHPKYNTFVFTLVIFNIIFNLIDVMNISPSILAMREAQKAISLVYKVINRKSTIDSFSEDGLRPSALHGAIEFHSVHFNYPSRPTTKVLDGISFKVNSGETLAIVGESGHGKSTVTQLIQRFYDPLEGQVTIDGINIKDLNIGWLRTNIGVVGQEPVLFSTTIADNIRIGKEDATQNEIEEAAKAAFAHDFIDKFPDKYETVIGDRGSPLSGGQKQMVAIARALIKNPKILLLDEATSSLDNESEVSVLKALKKASIGRTTIVIAHRLSTIQNSDNIGVICKGKIIEFGNHQQLVLKGEFYSNLIKRQSGAATTTLAEVAKCNKINSSFGEVDIENDPRKAFTKIARVNSKTIAPETTKTGIKSINESSIAYRLLQENSTELKYIVCCIIASVLSGSTMPLSVLLLGSNFNILTETNGETYNAQSLTVFMYFGILAGCTVIVVTFQHVMFAIYEGNLTMKLRARSFESILRQEMSWFDERSQNVGETYTNLVFDVANVMSAIKTCTLLMFEYISTILVVSIMCLVLNWKLGLLYIASVPFYIGAYVIENSAVHRLSEKEIACYKQTNKIAVEAISNIRTVASLHKEKSILKLYEIETEHLRSAGIRTAHVQGLMFGLTDSMVWFVMSAMSYYGSLLVLQEQILFANFMRLLRVSLVISRQLGFFISISSNVDKGILSAKRLYKLFDRISAIDPHDTSGKLVPLADDKAIQLRNVHFYYPSNKEVNILNGIDITVLKGQTAGIIGSSGCGKSTILQLLLRMYDPQLGTVYCAGEDVKKLNTKDLRANSAIVSQEPILFDRSIEENIAYGDNSRKIPFDEIVAAARAANIHTFITSLPDGYKTRVGGKGSFLSGGQKQRIAIARALVRNPKILLLDDATSSLDSENEKVVQEALDDAQVGRTCIIVAHRLSTFSKCNIIYSIHEGKVVELCKNSELHAEDVITEFKD